MSTKWTAELLNKRADRLDALSVAVAENRRDEFTMRVPADPDRDADLVLQDSASIIRAYAETLQSKPEWPSDADISTARDAYRASFDAENMAPMETQKFEAMRAALQSVCPPATTSLAVSSTSVVDKPQAPEKD